MITVAICTWNRADLLDQTLAGMRQLRIPDGVAWELLVVNNNSTDHTEAVIDCHIKELPIRRLFEPTPGKSHAANRVLAEARGEIILWTDDDVLVDSEWLSAAVGAARRHPEAGAFGGPIEPWFPTPPDPDLISAFPALGRGLCGIGYDLSEGPLPAPKPIHGANMILRRSRLHGLRFSTELGPRPGMIASDGGTIEISMGGGEEIDFITRLRTQAADVVWVPTMRVRHYVDPRRATIPYLSRGYFEGGRLMIRERGIPEGTRLAGVPRWLLRQWAEACLKRCYNRLWGRRVDALIWLQKSCYYHGMVLGCRDQIRAARRAT
jgi:glucosyl-dolichyl phosphate glucuronosyltransferase